MESRPEWRRADEANGYEAIADDFIRSRSREIGLRVVRLWARGFRPGASIVDLGCGHGIPNAAALIADGFSVFAIDASQTLIEEFRRRFPEILTERGRAEDSAFFNQQFQGVLAWGLLFLLLPEAQRILIEKVARALEPKGRFLFTAPKEICQWADVKTGRASFSLGREAYAGILAGNGLRLMNEEYDEGGNYYYFVEKR